MTIKDLVKDNEVHFQFYRKGHFYYTVSQYEPYDHDAAENLPNEGEEYVQPKKHWQFTIPLEDIGDGTLPKVDNALSYMRWIRKAMDTHTLIEIK